jgi:putative ABC transport system substrate-binding protein
MTRIVAVVMLIVAALAAPLAVEAQPGKVPRIGVLLYAAAPPPGQSNPFLDAFRDGLRDLGYIEGRNVILEYRWAGGSNQRAAELAAELVRLNVAVIMSTGTPATQLARAATTTIPIVMTAVGDPVGSGIVASLAGPGGNVTGLSLLDTDLDGKRIELLKEAVPGLTRIAMLWSPSDPGMTLAFGRVEVASHALRLALQSVALRDPSEFPEALHAAATGRAEALFVTAQPFTIRHQMQLPRPPRRATRRPGTAGGEGSSHRSIAGRRPSGYLHRTLPTGTPRAGLR